ncbi:MAG TPA: hypothetical protein PKC97_14965 [Burkholderiaceae bacterium]|nr:hypothetical protein [Burkholderiaceae bacterium]
MAAALGALDAGHASEALAEPRWRHAYPLHFRRLVAGAMHSHEAALASARAGLDAAWNELAFTRADGTGTTLRKALDDAAPDLHSTTFQGRGDARPEPWRVPLRGALLEGDALARQIDDWLARGIIEASAAAALQRCRRHPEWFDLSDRRLVLLGAGSEAGPLRWLARWRANIVAIDVAREPVWQRIAGIVAEGNARLVAPLRRAAAKQAGPAQWASDAGVDLLADAPAAAAWLRAIAAREGGLDIAALGYLDGERHVRLSLAMDMVQAVLCGADARTTLAWMATPTDVFAIPEATARRALVAYDARPALQRGLQAPLRLAAGERLFHPNVERIAHNDAGFAWGLADSLVVEQGPNYALAKRLQQWRAIVARDAGHRAVLNIAPSTTTETVVRNPALAAGFAGASAFGIEVFEPATTNAIMAALWVHDLRSDASAADPRRELAHPHELFMDNACHGGLWTGAYRARSALPLAAALGWLRGRLGLDDSA